MVLRNEKGVALLTVLFIIVVFTILGISILTVSSQSAKVRGVTNEETEGKMLADIGLQYLENYLSKQLNDRLQVELNQANNGIKDPTMSILGAMESPQPNDAIDKILQQVAGNYDKARNQSHYLTKSLPDNKGAFAIMYADQTSENTETNGSNPYQQPYSRKLKVTVVGIPGSPSGTASSNLTKVKLTSTVYINTVPGPFHFAISTPRNIYLYGGTDILGNMQVGGDIQTSSSYFYRESNVWKIDQGSNNNQPFIQGIVKMRTGGNVYKGNLVELNNGNHPEFSNATPTGIDRQSLIGVFTPKSILNDDGNISVDPNKTSMHYDIAPLISQSNSNIGSISFSGLILTEYIKQKFNDLGKLQIPVQPIVVPDPASSDVSPLQPIALEYNSEWNSKVNPNLEDPTPYFPPFRVKSPGGLDPNKTRKAVIYSNQGNKVGYSPQLTARLTGNYLKGINELYIGPDPSNNACADCVAGVEIGATGSFEDSPSNNSPFTFTGPIYIKGNLDIIGNINVQGTIFVDGDVLLREFTNGQNPSKMGQNPNLVIMATGKITIAKNLNSTSLEDINAFLYSDGQAIELYSAESMNRIYGGLATGSVGAPYIMLNTKRDSNYTPHATIQFNRGIFETPIPGLPSDNKFYLDIYDRIYINFQGDIHS